MRIHQEKQLSPVAGEVLALTAVVRPILRGVLYAVKREVVAEMGGYEGIKLKILPRAYLRGDGDCGICFEYAVHEALRMLPSTCAPSLIWRSEARTSPSIRPKTSAGPLHSMLPTIDMSEPMQEAIPAFVVGSDLAQAWSCGCTTLPMTSGAFAAAFLSFSVALLFMLFNMSTSFFRSMRFDARIGPTLRRSTNATMS